VQHLGTTPIGDYGELRAFLRPGPKSESEIAFELLREADGRAFAIRLPLRSASEFGRFLGRLERRLADDAGLTYDAEDKALLDRLGIATDDEIAALVLRQDGRELLALWRRERRSADWSWTLDALFAPRELGPGLCRALGAALGQIAPAQ
jgi:hypothetical protein